MRQLFAARFENDDDKPQILEQFTDVERIGVRWSIESFGVDRIEVVVRARSLLDVYDRLEGHSGLRLAIYDSLAHRPVSGNIVRVERLDARRVLYVARGPIWRHDDTLVRSTFPTGQDTNERLEDLLSNHVNVASDDYTDIDATGKDAAEYQTEWPRGNYPSEIIKAYRKMSDASNNPWDYWCVDEPLDGVYLGKFKPYFKSRNSLPVSWRVSLADLSSLRLSRSIEELRSFARVWYGSFEGSVTTANAAGTTLIDSVANFTGFQVEPGDRVTNITDGSRGKVKTVDSGSQITLVGDGLLGGTDDDFDVSDEYTIERQDAWYSATATAASAVLTRHLSVADSKMRFEQAQSYADALVDFYGVAIQQQPFVITAPYVRDARGAKRPLFDMVAEGGGIIQIVDLFPSASQFSDALDQRTTFFITSMDYDNVTNSLRVGVDSLDGRLDAQLRASGIIGGEMIARGGSI